MALLIEEEPQKKTRQVNVHLTEKHWRMMMVVCRYEGITSAPVLIREWIRKRLKAYQTNPRFKRYLKTHPEEATRLEGFLP